MTSNQSGARRGDAGQAAGEHRITHADLFDAEVRPHNERFRAATAVGPGDRVLDIGCGAGESTRDAARVAVSGHVVGLDLSPAILEYARRVSDNEGLRTITFVQGNAQTHALPAGGFDLCISRFGAMFFADPVAAFANVRDALRPGARLVLLVWQDHGRNEWSWAIRAALDVDTAAPATSPAGTGPFSLADPDVAEGILTAAGFTDVVFTDVHEPVFYGPDVATAYDLVLGLRHVRELLADLGPALAEQALGRLRATLAAHETDRGVHFDSRAWIITARRP
ncbi:class I SAM-dependent methyltransferase [Actinopolymorpha pittospori]